MNEERKDLVRMSESKWPIMSQNASRVKNISGQKLWSANAVETDHEKPLLYLRQQFQEI